MWTVFFQILMDIAEGFFGLIGDLLTSITFTEVIQIFSGWLVFFGVCLLGLFLLALTAAVGVSVFLLICKGLYHIAYVIGCESIFGIYK